MFLNSQILKIKLFNAREEALIPVLCSFSMSVESIRCDLGCLHPKAGLMDAYYISVQTFVALMLLMCEPVWSKTHVVLLSPFAYNFSNIYSNSKQTKLKINIQKDSLLTWWCKYNSRALKLCSKLCFLWIWTLLIHYVSSLNVQAILLKYFRGLLQQRSDMLDIMDLLIFLNLAFVKLVCWF